MKNVILNFANGLLSREQMKKVKGGYGWSSGGCGSQSSYTCSYTIRGGDTVSGTGCGSSSAEASRRLGDLLRSNGVDYSSVGC